MNLNVSSIESERKTIIGEAVDLFLNFSSKLPDTVVKLSNGKISMDKRVKILCPFIGDLLSSALDEHSIIIIPDFSLRTFDCISRILIEGYGKYYSHDVKEVVELARALNIDGIDSLLVSKVGGEKDSEEGSILTDNESKKNKIFAKIKRILPKSKASEMKKDLNKLSAKNLVKGNIDAYVNEYHEDNKVELKVNIDSEANIGDFNSSLVLASKVADGKDVDDDREEGEIVSDEEETMKKDIVSRIEIAEFSKIFRDVPNIVSKHVESFKCKFNCKKSFFSVNALNCHLNAKHSSHARTSPNPNIMTYYEEIMKRSSLNSHIIAKYTKKQPGRLRNLAKNNEIVVFKMDTKRKHKTSSFHLRKKGRINRERKPSKLKPMDNLCGPFTKTVGSLIVDKGDDRNAVVGVNLYYVLHKKDSTRNIDSRSVFGNPEWVR